MASQCTYVLFADVLEAKRGSLSCHPAADPFPYGRTFGILPSGIGWTCPGQRSRHRWRRAYRLSNSAQLRSMTLLTRSDQLIPRMRISSAKMKDPEASLLSGVDAPILDAVEQHADDVSSPGCRPGQSFMREQRLPMQSFTLFMPTMLYKGKIEANTIWHRPCNSCF